MSGASAFRKLSEPLQIRQVRFRNRIVKPPQRMSYADRDGSVTPRALDFYESIAKGGVGALIVEHAYVDFPLGVRGTQFSAADDRCIPGLTSLAAIIRKHGCPAIQQISHAGPQFDSDTAGVPAVGPSALDVECMRRTLPRPYTLKQLTISEIERIVEKFAQAAGRVKMAGYDGLEVHGGHGYLVASFLSGIWNKRTDGYGGSVENRARFAASILRAVRDRVGRDFVVGVRMNGGE